MNVENKIKLVRCNVNEIIAESELIDLFSKKKKPVVYLGYAATGLLHIGHLIPMIKLVDMHKAGFKCKILVADLHAFLDSKKTPWDELEDRSKVYADLIKASIKAIGLAPTKVCFEKGSDIQMKPSYVLDLFKLFGEITMNRSKRAAAEVVRFGTNPKVGGFVYPLLQALDTKGMNADAAIGGVDQRSIYMLARETLELVDYKKPVTILTPILSDLYGKKSGKMSSSNKNYIISLVDTKDEIEQKINKAYCPAKTIENNGLLDICKLIVFPILNNHKKKFIITRAVKHGGNIIFEEFKDLEVAYVQGNLHPADFKKAISYYLYDIISVICNNIKDKELLEKIYWVN